MQTPNQLPPTPNRPTFFPVARPDGRPERWTFTSRQWNGLRTHWIHDQAVLCKGTRACPHCTEKIGSRWHAFITAINHDTGSHVLLELSAGAIGQLAEMTRLLPTLRGYTITTHRAGPAQRGRVIIKLEPRPGVMTNFPDEPDLAAAVNRLYQYEQTTWPLM
jgi:hypothetical protein